jgi:hypothetical protein
LPAPERGATLTSVAAVPELTKETVEALLGIVEGVVEDERSRSQALVAKTSTLAGFSGTILAIVAVLGRESFKLDVGDVGDPLMRCFFIVSVVTLAAAAALAIGGVLRPVERLVLGTEQVIEFGELRWLTRPKVEVQGEMIETLGKALERERKLNTARAQLATWAAVALLVGLLAVAGQALTLGIDALAYGRDTIV